MMIGGTSARVTLQALVPGWGGVESGSWLALFRAGQSSAGRFVGIAISTNLFSGHEGELFHLNCTMRLSVSLSYPKYKIYFRSTLSQGPSPTPLA